MLQLFVFNCLKLFITLMCEATYCNVRNFYRRRNIRILSAKIKYVLFVRLHPDWNYFN
jgi:hypothetical protein